MWQAIPNDSGHGIGLMIGVKRIARGARGDLGCGHRSRAGSQAGERQCSAQIAAIHDRLVVDWHGQAWRLNLPRGYSANPQETRHSRVPRWSACESLTLRKILTTSWSAKNNRSMPRSTMGHLASEDYRDKNPLLVAVLKGPMNTLVAFNGAGHESS